jgi:AraC-like DNA-binding protein
MYAGENLLLKKLTLKDPIEWGPDKRRLCFLFGTQGGAKCQVGNVAHDLRRGDLLVLNRKNGGKISPLDSQGFTAQRFLLCFDHLSSLLGVEEICVMEKVAARFSGAKYYPASSGMVSHCQTLLEKIPSVTTLEHRVILLRVASIVLSEEFEQAKKERARSNNGNDDFAQLMNRLSLQDVQDLSVEELAKKMGYSRRHLNRLFHDHLGTSVSALKMETRLLKSLRLLRDPSVKVIDVAMECGFNHLGLFSQCFKRRFHLSPHRWRQAELSKAPAPDETKFIHKDCQFQSNGLCMWTNVQKNNGGEVPCGALKVCPANGAVKNGVAGHVP